MLTQSHKERISFFYPPKADLIKRRVPGKSTKYDFKDSQLTSNCDETTFVLGYPHKDFWQDLSQEIRVHKWFFMSELKITFNKPFRSDKSQDYEMIGKCINKYLKNLRVLELEFLESVVSSYVFTPPTITLDGFVNLSNFTSLRKFRLCVRNGNSITNGVLERLSLNILDAPICFEELTIQLIGCVRITDHGFQSFAKNFRPKIGKLEHLALDFSGASGLKNDATKALGDHIIPKLGNLRYLGLKFDNCPFKTGIIADISTKFDSRFAGLQHLWFGFRKVSQLTDDDIETLISVICSKMKNIKSLSLNFAWCDKLTEKSFERIQNWIKDSPSSLRLVKLNFSNCPKISENAKNSMRETLKTNPQIVFHVV